MFSEQFNLSYFGKINVKENKNSCDYFINFFQGHLVQQVASATRHHWGQTGVTSCVVGGATTQRLWRNLTNVTVNSTGVAMSNVNFVPSAWIFILVRDLVSMIMAILWMDKSFVFHLVMSPTLESAILRSAIGLWCQVTWHRHNSDKRPRTFWIQYLLKYLYWLCLYRIYLFFYCYVSRFSILYIMY